MIRLTFQKDTHILSGDRSDELIIADASILQETYFVMPVQFSIDHLEMLEIESKGVHRVLEYNSDKCSLVPIQRTTHSTPSLQLPILGVATVGLAVVQQLKQGIASYYSLPGYGWRIQFLLSDDKVFVRSEVNQRVAHVSYLEIISAFQNFSREVRHVMGEYAPEILLNPVWSSWFPNG